MKTGKRKIGDLGENITEKFLVKQGFDILRRNYLKPWGEIDIVAKKQECFYFVEVKSVISDFVNNDSTYNPAENVHPGKLARLSRVIQTYMLENNIDGDWKFSVACVFISLDRKKARVQFFSDIVL